MAFQAPVNLQAIASATTEIWPSISSVLSNPWRTLRRDVSAIREKPTVTSRTFSTTTSRPVQDATPASVPEFLANVNLASLRQSSVSQGGLGSHSISSIVRAVPQNGLNRCNPLASSLPSLPRPYFRQYSTALHTGSVRWHAPARTLGVGLLQHRTLLGGNTSRNLLAHLEQTANNNPQSATAQNAFYSALLRANMPEIIVERYQTGRYASNAACEQMYIRALERTGSGGSGILTSQLASSGAGARDLSGDQLSAVAQAAAARARGGNVGSVRGGSGDKSSPLYVVVDESIGNSVFKWVKFLLWFALLTYLSLVAITVFVEATSVVKKIGGSQNAEARPELQNTRFSDVHGCDEAKDELQELVEFLKAPDKFNNLGGKLPKGVLLVGPPGTGKTLLARAVAGEAGVPFFYMSGSEFDEVYVGVGAKRVRDLFNSAKAKAPAIVFIDELDAVGGKRNERDAAYSKQTLNQLLTDLDGFDQNSGVVFLAATNFPKLLDKALTRPGRFDRNIVVPLPDVRGRAAILSHHMRNVQIGTDVDATIIARNTPGFSGADLENVVNQAAVRASKNKAKKVHMIDFDWARERIMMGAERKSAVIQQKDKVATAYHEGGHALVSIFNPECDPLYKVTILPRGQALGITSSLPELDRVSMAKKQFIAMIDMAMGGKVAEEIIYGPDAVTSGCSSDLQNATGVAYAMVTQYGMSDGLGNVDLHSEYRYLSSETKQRIENEVRSIIEDSRERVTKLLTLKRRELELLAKALVEYETLDKSEVEKILKGEKLPNKVGESPQEPSGIKLPDSLLPPPVQPPVVSPGSAGLGGNSASGT
ncbi:ATP-dependent metallopeptidase Hfl [Viridothelium virens]|uniref:ATP-dependent metallopeptidase Hfl n=1 Tax=Viridothelium virens TaxID=1048519 RepID=A0A6A6HEU7_VIRVR|nr:ATP-dependent metallopeptidase Hfl [Viridothelium virens]